ncbi:MAG: GerMN domain-containing protein [Eubacteriales bacterium]|nr:GerMN domain-containing protein [Eubacteriales bacterium]
MRKKTLALLALLSVLCLALSGCVTSPPDSLMRAEPADASALVDAQVDTLPGNEASAALYFRYGTSAYLAPEQRQITIEKNESPEKALVKALVAGPSASASALSPLFPPGTEVLAVSGQGDTLYVTFNEALLGRYSDEPGDTSADAWKREFPLRRQLCMDSLAATLTEAGYCVRVQVLVYREVSSATSLRLTNSFFSQDGDTTPISPLTRDEENLLTPHNAASLVLTAWMTQDWDTLYSLLKKDDPASPRPAGQAAFAAFSAARVITGFQVDHGNVSADGQVAVVNGEMTLRADGEDAFITGYPLRLERENGLWKISYKRLLALMNQE